MTTETLTTFAAHGRTWNRGELVRLQGSSRVYRIVHLTLRGERESLEVFGPLAKDGLPIPRGRAPGTRSIRREELASKVRAPKPRRRKESARR